MITPKRIPRIWDNKIIAIFLVHLFLINRNWNLIFNHYKKMTWFRTDNASKYNLRYAEFVRLNACNLTNFFIPENFDLVYYQGLGESCRNLERVSVPKKLGITVISIVSNKVWWNVQSSNAFPIIVFNQRFVNNNLVAQQHTGRASSPILSFHLAHSYSCYCWWWFVMIVFVELCGSNHVPHTTDCYILRTRSILNWSSLPRWFR